MVEKLYWIGRIKVPKAVKTAIDLKIKATQDAQRTENELRETEAKAKKNIAEAQGLAEAIRLRAIAEAEANRIVAQSISQNLIEYEKVKRWDGKLSQVSGASALINMK